MQFCIVRPRPRFRSRFRSCSMLSAFLIAMIASASVRADEIRITGPAGHTATITRPAPNAPLAAIVLDPSGNRIGAITTPADRLLVVGAAGLARVPRADHAIGARYAIEFLRFDGTPLAADEREDLALHTLQPQEDGTWIAHGMQKPGRHELLRYDDQGGLLWRLALAGRSAPIALTNPSGDRTAIGTLSEDGRSHLVIVNRTGTVLRNEIVDEFRRVLFDQDGTQFALAGGETVQLRASADGSLIGAERLSESVALGVSLAFGSGPGQVYVVTQDAPTAGGEVRFYSISFAPGATTRVVRSLPGMATTGAVRITDLVSLTTGRVEVAAGDRRLTVDLTTEEDER